MNRYTVEPGRAIFKDGKPFICIERDCDPRSREYVVSPIEADMVTHRICNLLNASEPACRHDSSTTTDGNNGTLCNECGVKLPLHLSPPLKDYR